MDQPLCGDRNPEANAGDPVDDGWDMPAAEPAEAPAQQNGGDDSGHLDPGALPGQPA